MLKLRNHNIILPKYLEIVKKKGSSLNFSASGGWSKEKKTFLRDSALNEQGGGASLRLGRGGIPPTPPFRPPRPKAEAKRTISSFSNPPLADCSASPSLTANYF